MFSLDQFTHILPPSIWSITMPRYYFYHQKSEMLWEKSAKVSSELMSTRPNWVLVLMALMGDTSELRSTGHNSVGLVHQMPLQGVHLNSGQPDQMANHLSCWPDVVLLLVTRCLYQGVHLTNMMTYNVEAFKCNLPPQLKVNLYIFPFQFSRTLGLYMPLPSNCTCQADLM